MDKDKDKDKWAGVIKYLRSSGRDPAKVLKLLQGNQKGVESNYSIARSSYSMNVIATITQKLNDPKNKGKTLTHVIRQWVKSKDFEDFYNLIRSPERLVLDKVEANKTQNKYIKQIKDLWDQPNQKKYRDYFAITKGYFITGTGSGIGRRKIKDNLFGANEKIIKAALPKLKKRFKTKTK